MPKSIREVLTSVPPFSLLPIEVIELLETKVTVSTFPKGHYVFRQGQESLRTLFLIVGGSAEVVASNKKGDESVVSFRGIEEFFGETGLNSGHYSASIRVKEEMTCLLIPGEEVERFIGKHSDFTSYLTDLLVERMRSLYDEIIHEQSFEDQRVETPLFRKRVSDIMSSPVITCSIRDTVVEVANLMKSKNISAVIVVDKDNHPVGSISNADLVHNILARSITNYDNIIAGTIMKDEVVSLSSDAFYAEALMAIIKYRTKHLVIIRKEKLVGIVTVADLVKFRSTGSLAITQDIELQEDIDELAKIGTAVDELLSALVDEKVPVQEILSIVSELNERLTTRVIQLCELEMISEGYGRPPVEYCWVNTGSAGRREQTYRTDQDNFIIYGDRPEEDAKSIQDYFIRLAGKVNTGLEKCGFEKCPGDIMASNKEWCRSLNSWEKVIKGWIDNVSKDPKAVRQLTIILDFRAVHGGKTLADRLWEMTIRFYQDSEAISHYLTQDDLSARVPVTMWGGFVTEKSGLHKDEINLKSSVSVHIVDCIRIFALKNSIKETNTFSRIEQLRKNGGLNVDDADFVEAAYETLMMFRIRENLKKVIKGEKADNYINPLKLSKQEREILKGAFAAVTRLQKLTSASNTLPWLGN
ncbi:MAG: CBS domain-containing protein [Peptococcaceae bacterium]|nr:CBS domain-containing protein [Peptococcaceae bacterium]